MSIVVEQRLEEGVDRFGAAATQPLRAALIERAAPGFDVACVAQSTSTNTELLQRARDAQPQRPQLLAALVQTAGRGRHGRRWHASPGSALLFSIAVPLEVAARSAAAATLACGIGAAEALRAAGVAVMLKWPNDLLLGERKLGGILCELAVDARGANTLVAGIGINLRLDAATRDSIGAPAAALAEVLEAASLLQRREALIAAVAVAVVEALRRFEAQGFVALQPRFMALFAHRDRIVEVVQQQTCVGTGRALGVDGGGRLLLQTSEGVKAIDSGEVSLRVST